MNTEKRTASSILFSKQLEQYRILSQKLGEDNRNDEAIFAKIQRNVCEIFASVFSAGQQVAGEDDTVLLDFCLTRFRQIPQNWQTALTHARQHQKSEQVHIEQLKLDTATHLQTEFEKIWEVYP